MAAPRKVRLTRKRGKWVEERNQATLVGAPLKPSAAVAKRYQAEIDKLITAMLKDYYRELRSLYKREAGVTMDANIGSQARILLNKLGDKWLGRFASAAKDIVGRMMGQADKAATSQLNASLKELSGGITINTPEMPKSLADKVAAAVANNMALLKSVPQQYHYKVEGAVLRSIEQGGGGAHDIYNTAMQEITATGINVQKRAALIAQLETAKVSAMVQTERMQAVGITKFRWRHSNGGAAPRQLHLDYDGRVFDLNDPPIIDPRSGQKGMPGTIWRCRCFAVPVLEFGNGLYTS